ncbi:MAG: hypothetical protein KDI64_19875, partial [Candidatus Accumulibacter sp.]|nr:hypothetical protein [Accumulibacter sp.]
SYVSLTSTNVASGTVVSGGRISAVGKGSGVLVAERGDLRAATSFTVGTPTETVAAYVFGMGIDVYPGAVALVENGGRRQIVASLAGQIDLTPASSGTRYFVGDDRVLSVSADGLITGKAAGNSTVTVINGGGEFVLSARVEAPVSGPAVLGSPGGIVKGADGSVVAVAAGALAGSTQVSIAALTPAALPLAMPESMPMAGAFRLDVGDGKLATPVQLAIPTSGLAAGTKVVFMRYAEIPTPEGKLLPVWLQEETGIVGDDGMARTSSPPYAGVAISGVYVAGVASDVNFGQVRGRTYATFPSGINDGGSSFATLSSLGGGAAIGAAFSLTSGFIMTALFGSRELQIISVPAQGLPQRTTLGVEIDPGKVSDYSIQVVNPYSPSTSPASEPFISEARLVFRPAGSGDVAPFVEIKGDRFTYDNPPAPASAKDGSVITDLFVIFVTPDGRTHEVHPDASSTPTEVIVRVPQSVAIGTAKVYVRRPQVLSNNGAWNQLVGKESNRVQLSYDARYVFGGLSGSQLLVIDSQTRELAARIPIGGTFPAPRSVAISADNTRAYAALRYGSSVAVVDTVALQQVDADADLANGVSNIELLPGARPFWIAAGKGGKKAYVSDEVAGRIYVLDIDPSSGSYNKLVRTLDVAPAPSGLRGMAINANGTRLFVAAPEKALFGGSGSGDGRVFVIDVDEGSATYGEVLEVLAAGGEPYGVSATNDASVMLYTNRLSDSKGVVIVKGDVGSYTQTAVAMNLGSFTDYFDVNNAIAVVLSKDGDYAFVSGFNVFIQDNPSHDPNYDPFHPAGGNVGIIRDPLGAAPMLVAATRPVPMSWPDNLVLSPDGDTLYAAYRGQRVVMGFDVQAMIDAVNNPAFAAQLDRKPIDDLDPSINVRSNFKIIEPGSRFKDPVFGVPPGEEASGPIGVGGQANGLVAQGGASLELLAPGALTSDLTPTFSWLVKGFENAKSRLYVSTYRGSDGLFPTDLGTPDLNADRIFSSDLLDASSVDAQGAAIFIKALAATLKLTAGQQYFWGVEVVSPAGTVVARDWRVVRTEAFRDASKPFSSVTLLTHGFQLSPTAPANVADSIAAFLEMGENIARAGGEGVAALYQKTTGRWLVFYNGATSVTGVDLETVLASPATAGRPVVLISDWYDESDFPTNGFSEAAADTFYSALARLNFNLGNDKLFKSPIHLIGHSRGTVVNSEIAQRFGIYSPTTRLSMTSLDVHDFNQPSLDIPVGEYIQLFGATASALGAPAIGTLAQLWGMLPTNTIIPTGNFLDPDVQRWSNIDFAEHYYQILASNTALPVGGGIVSTPNGRFVPNFDVSMNLNGRAGFTADDGLATLTALNDGSLRPGGPHSRVWRWYGATTDLSVTEFAKGGEPVFRRLADKDATEFQGVSIPWYNAQSYALGMGPWEGIGTGWAFSPQGGVPFAGTPSNTRIPVSFDNSETINPSGLPVPSVFNGDFEEGALNRSWLLQFSAGGLATNLSGDLPGWSFHGGGFQTTRTLFDGDRLITLANGTHAAMLDNDNSWIQHNRMVVPDWAEYLSFDVQVLDAAAGETLRVQGFVPDTASWIDLGSVAVDSQGNSFVNRQLEVPVEFRGAERMLRFSLSGGGSANAEILLDHVQFMRGLIVDSTTDQNDKGVFFTDTATGPTSGLSSQWVELTNRFPDAVTVTVTTDPNDFLVVVDGPFEKLLNDNQAHAPLYQDLVVSPGATLHIDLKARFGDDFVKTYADADLPIEKTALYFTITLSNGSIRDELVDLFYLPDFADGDASDGVWTMMDTLDGKTRTLTFDNAAQVDVKPLSNPTGQFSVDESGGIAQGIKYQSVYTSAIDDFAEFQIEEGGR